MARDWETWLRNSIGPASATEEQDRDRTEKRIRDAIVADSRLAGRVRVFAKGSYANNTNVRLDSDVDIAVEWTEWSYTTKTNQAAELSWERLGVRLGADLGPHPDGVQQLVWVYTNIPRPEVRDRSPIHHGAVVLSAPRDPTPGLQGEYFTDRKTRGELRFTWRDHTLVESHAGGRAQMRPKESQAAE